MTWKSSTVHPKWPLASAVVKKNPCFLQQCSQSSNNKRTGRERLPAKSTLILRTTVEPSWKFSASFSKKWLSGVDNFYTVKDDKTHGHPQASSVQKWQDENDEFRQRFGHSSLKIIETVNPKSYLKKRSRKKVKDSMQSVWRSDEVNVLFLIKSRQLRAMINPLSTTATTVTASLTIRYKIVNKMNSNIIPLLWVKKSSALSMM